MYEGEVLSELESEYVARHFDCHRISAGAARRSRFAAEGRTVREVTRIIGVPAVTGDWNEEKRERSRGVGAGQRVGRVGLQPTTSRIMSLTSDVAHSNYLHLCRSGAGERRMIRTQRAGFAPRLATPAQVPTHRPRRSTSVAADHRSRDRISELSQSHCTFTAVLGGLAAGSCRTPESVWSTTRASSPTPADTAGFIPDEEAGRRRED